MLSLASQGLNTAQNLLLAVLVARNATAPEYGGWGVAYAVYVASQSLTRSMVSAPQMIALGPGAAKREVAGAAMAVSLPISVLLVAVTPFLSGEVSRPLLAVAVILPFTLMHDALRYAAIRDRATMKAIQLDAIWLGMQVLATLAVVAAGLASPMALTAAWGAGALLACIFSAKSMAALPDLRRGIRMLQNEWRAGSAMSLEAFIGTIAANSVPVVVASFVGLAAAGHFRGGMTIAGGIGLFISGLMPLMTVEFARKLHSGESAGRLVVVWSLLIAGGSAAYWLIFLIIPDAVGSSLLGASWSGTRALLVMFALQSIVRGPFVAVPIIMRCRRQFRAAIQLRLHTSWIQLAGPAVGAMLWGVEGAAWAYAVTMAVNSIQSVVALRTGPQIRPREVAD